VLGIAGGFGFLSQRSRRALGRKSYGFRDRVEKIENIKLLENRDITLQRLTTSVRSSGRRQDTLELWISSLWDGNGGKWKDDKAEGWWKLLSLRPLPLHLYPALVQNEASQVKLASVSLGFSVWSSQVSEIANGSTVVMTQG
jgi:hypothetical protein